MLKNNEKYFTIGEFSKLYGITKQTLIYYDKNQIFSPELIDDNGYRYYSLHQYFLFDIILNLKKIGVPLQDIAKYIKNRNINTLKDIFINKKQEYQEQIATLQKYVANLEIVLNNLEQSADICENEITLEKKPEEYLILSDLLNFSSKRKQRIETVAAHYRNTSVNQFLNICPLGMILSQSDLLEKNYEKISRVFTKITAPDENKHLFIKPKGLYISIFFKGSYAYYAKCAFLKLTNFININNLQIIGDAYITPIRNLWETNNPEEYITNISIPVKYIT